MNYSDAERISTYLEKLGLEPAFKNKADLPAKDLESADLIVFVTCGVRQSAEDRVYGQISNLRKKYPEKIIVLTGCLAHRKDVQLRLRGKVDLFFSINSLGELENWIIDNYLKIVNCKLKIPARKYCTHNKYLSIKPIYKKAYQAFVPVMTGCNNFCAYCVVPYARGREYSRPAEDILKEVKSLVKEGCKEIVLLGQNVNSYRSGKINFPKLLKLIEKIFGRFWLTFLTSHPKDMSRELIETISKSKKTCEYVSLPAQSGDDDILRKMNRKYSIDHYRDLVNKIRAAYKKYHPEVFPSISTDIIVGFPGETKKQFENTAKLFREMEFDMSYISQYSPRPETAAWKLKDNVSKKEKIRREKVLTKILEKTALENNKKYVDKTVEVLVDKRFDLEKFRTSARKGKVEPWKEKYQGHARTQKKVIFFSKKMITVGSFAKVKITKAKAFGLEGELLI